MSPAEVAWRARDQALQAAWSRRQVTREQLGAAAPPPGEPQRSRAVLPRGNRRAGPRAGQGGPPGAARTGCCGANGKSWASTRTDLVQPDWFRDPVTGRRSDPGRYAFRIDHRSEEQVGNVKQVWEISRLQHLTLLATAWFLTRDEEYATPGGRPAPLLVAGEPLPVRRALDQRHRARHPPDQPGLDPAPARRLARRSRPVRGRRARGAADPVAPAVSGRVPEPGLVGQQPRDRRGGRAARGQLRLPVVRRKASAGGASPRSCSSASSSATPSRRASAASSPRITSASSPNSGSSRRSRPRRAATRSARSPGSGWARWRTARRPWSTSGCGRLGRVTPTKAGRCCSTLRWPTAGRRCWRWPKRWSAGSTGGRGRRRTRAARSSARWRPPRVTSRAGPASGRRDSPTPGSRCCARPARDEIWCRCDGGPHGYLSIAAHAHADALSVEVRYGGVDILADPGTYCYHGEPRVAVVLPLDDRAQHRRNSTAGTSRARAAPSCGCGTRRPGRSRSSTTAT